MLLAAARLLVPAAQSAVAPAPDVRAVNLARDREIAAQFAPVFYQALGTSPRFDYITRFDFDDDWRGDNNWNDAANHKFRLDAYVYYAVFETRTHFFVHYAVFHPRDYKGGLTYGPLLSHAIRAVVRAAGVYDPTGSWNEAVLAHENDLEGALVVAEKSHTLSRARVAIVETLAHNEFLKYTPPGSSFSGEGIRMDGLRPILFVEPMGHGITAWVPDAAQKQFVDKGLLVYRFAGKAGNADKLTRNVVDYDLLPIVDTFWARAQSGKGETWGELHDYGTLKVQFAEGEKSVERRGRLGVIGSAFSGNVGAANMGRPPWGWFDARDRARPLGEWFLLPAETVQRHWKAPRSFSTVYTYNPFLSLFRN
jgi:hypothetical protein